MSRDFVLPQPLLEPELWPRVERSDRVRLALDLVAGSGGPLHALAHLALENGGIEWSLSPGAEHWERGPLASEMKRWLKATGTSGHFFGDSLKTVGEERAWLRALYPRTLTELGETEFERRYLDWSAETRAMKRPVWDAAGFFPGLLRQSGATDASELAAWDRARFQALYSPQDERAERLSLAPGEVILNPAAQPVELKSRGELRWVVRGSAPRWALNEIVLNWMEAALIDHITESFRSPLSKALAEVEADFAGGSFKEKGEQLIRSGILLYGGEI